MGRKKPEGFKKEVKKLTKVEERPKEEANPEESKKNVKKEIEKQVEKDDSLIIGIIFGAVLGFLGNITSNYIWTVLEKHPFFRDVYGLIIVIVFLIFLILLWNSLKKNEKKKPKKIEERKSESRLKKPINSWLFLALVLILILFGLLIVHNLGYFFPKGDLPVIKNFEVSKVNIFVEVSNKLNIFNKDVAVQNDLIVFDFNITNSADQKVEIEYNYHFIRPINTEWIYAGDMTLNQNESETDAVGIQLKDLGVNIIEFEFKIFDAKTGSFKRNYLEYFYFQVISQSNAMELNYRRLYVAILILALLPSSVIATKNLRDLYLEK